MPNGLSFEVAPVAAGAAPVSLPLLLPAQDASVPTRGPVRATASVPRMKLRRSKAFFSVLISCSYLSGVVVVVSGVPAKPVAVLVLEAVVVLVASGDVGGQVDGRSAAGRRQSLGGPDGEQLRDEGRGHRRHGAGRDVAGE